MKNKKTKQIIITCVLLVAVLLVATAFTVAWYQQDAVTPYFFEITADGLLYVYIDSIIVDNEEGLTPAVAMPGAVQEGLYVDPLVTYNSSDDNPSYVQKPASISNINGAFKVYNEGWAYRKVELEKDEDGYTLYPKFNSDGTIVWLDEENRIWDTTRKELFDGENSLGYSKETDYKPKLDASGNVVWNAEYSAQGGPWPYVGSEYWECEEVVAEGSTTATCNFTLRFKQSGGYDENNNEVNLDDYYADGTFAIKRIYFSTSKTAISEGAVLGDGNDGKAFLTLADDNTSGSFEIYGSEEIYFHAEVYLNEVDELLDPEMRGKPVYLEVGISVVVGATPTPAE